MSAVDLFSAFAVDATQEQEGVLTQVPNAGDTLFKIARSGNKQFSRLIQAQFKRNRAVLESKGDAAADKSDEIMIDVMAKSILVGWEGTVLYKGKALEYSPANARKLLAIKDFRKAVAQFADDVSAFKFKETEEQGKA